MKCSQLTKTLSYMIVFLLLIFWPGKKEEMEWKF